MSVGNHDLWKENLFISTITRQTLDNYFLYFPFSLLRAKILLTQCSYTYLKINGLFFTVYFTIVYTLHSRMICSYLIMEFLLPFDWRKYCCFLLILFFIYIQIMYFSLSLWLILVVLHLLLEDALNVSIICSLLLLSLSFSVIPYVPNNWYIKTWIIVQQTVFI